MMNFQHGIGKPNHSYFARQKDRFAQESSPPPTPTPQDYFGTLTRESERKEDVGENENLTVANSNVNKCK